MTNREADYDADDPEVAEAFSRARLYALAQAPELTIMALQRDDELRAFWICIGRMTGQSHCCGRVDLSTFPGVDMTRELVLEIGTVTPGRPPWSVKAWYDEVGAELFVHITPVRLLYWKSIGHLGVSGFEDYRRFLSFRLHYFGMTDDAQRRLFTGGHAKRSRILSREQSMEPGAALSDELLILLFSLSTEHLSTWLPNAGFAPAVPYDALVADAEKALIHVLRPKHNDQLYENYPAGRDGLFGSGLLRYAYRLGEDLRLCTDSATFVGGREVDSEGSLVVVEGEQVARVRCDARAGDDK